MDGKKLAGIILNILIPILAVYLVLFWGVKILAFFMPFVIGWIIALIANPPVRFLENKLKIKRRHSSFILVGIVLAVVIGLLYLVTIWAVNNIGNFIDYLPDLFVTLETEVTIALERIEELLAFIPINTDWTFSEVLNAIVGYASNYIRSFAASAGSAAAHALPDFLVWTIVIILSSYLFIVEHDNLIDAGKKIIPQTLQDQWVLLKKDLKEVVFGYFLAQFKIMLVVVVILLIGFAILRVRFSAILVLVLAILDFLPVVGSGTVLIPWAILKFFTGDYSYAIGLLVLYIVIQAVRQIIQPKIVGDSMGISPLASLFFLFIGFRLYGLAGMIIAVPVGIIIIRLYERGTFKSFIDNCRLLWHEIQNLRGNQT